MALSARELCAGLSKSSVDAAEATPNEDSEPTNELSERCGSEHFRVGLTVEDDVSVHVDEGESVDVNKDEARVRMKDLNVEDLMKSWNCSDCSKVRMSEGLMVDAVEVVSVKEANPAEDVNAAKPVNMEDIDIDWWLVLSSPHCTRGRSEALLARALAAG